MANPLKELSLKPIGFQFIQELPIDAPPEKVWAALLNVGDWFRMEDGRPRPKTTLDARPGGQWLSYAADGTASLFATVTLVEPKKLLRLAGQIGMSHLPVTHVVIFELQPRAGGKATLLRLGQRSFGFMEEDTEKRMQGGWGQLLPQLKEAAEKK